MPDFFSGTCVSFATSLCHSSGFCIAFCAVLALNYQAVQGKACTSAAKYEHLPFFLKAMLKYLFSYCIFSF